MNVSNIYQDTGFYICNVSNGIPDYRGNVFQLGRAYYLVSTGPPVFSGDNRRIPDNNKESKVEIKVKVYSPSEIICHHITEIGGKLVRLQNMEVRMKHILIKESFHDAIVTVNGIEITFVLHGLYSFGCRKFNVTVCNRYGQSSVYVDLQQYVSYSSEEKTVSSQGILILALLILIVILVAGMGIYFRYLKKRYKQRMITAVNIQTPERNGEESAHYAEIIEDDNIRTPSQGNNISIISTADRMVAASRNLISVFDEHSSTASENDTNAAESLDDGYEKPYTTLVENIEAEDNHVYLITKDTPKVQSISFCACSLWSFL
ncbi:uncharacterized protein LOC127717851 isoform X2 [Mytilus californianus]|uniref:uncharacterized protein LOC127717851 isoform X2 n=1 Tax=Mytilus californianus TaxID=6549 RepID=UPI002246EC16|nr:uncharacterized protein LOC127717851 isoform X2 [Mytilus californianus]